MMEDRIDNLIFEIRDVQVMLDSDLAVLFDVETKVFNQAVKRNINRFPASFRFQLTKDEFSTLRSQIVASSSTVIRSRNVTLNKDSLSIENGSLFKPLINITKSINLF